MNDDELLRALRAGRPRTDADDGWAETAAADEALARVQSRASAAYDTRGLRIRLPRPATHRRPVFAGLAAAAVVVTGASLLLGTSGGGSPAAAPATHSASPQVAHGATPRGRILLTGYDTCAGALAGLRSHTAAQVGRNGLPYDPLVVNSGMSLNTRGSALTVGSAELSTSAPQATTSGTNGTNTQEAGVDEPDTVKADGRRIITVSGSTLRVTDVATHVVTGTLDLGAYAGAGGAQLLLTGDRVLVLLGGQQDSVYGGGLVYPGLQPMSSASTTVLLVDLAHDRPSVVSMFRPKGELLDARLVGGTARLVVRSTPDLTLTPTHLRSDAKRRTAFQEQVRRAPIGDWLPTWTVTDGGATSSHTLPCGDLSHPAVYTGLSTTTVYSVDPSAGFGDVAPVSLAADGGTVYASADSLYLASRSDRGTTQLHRFDISRAGRPTYLGSGSVAGSVATSYSMSEWDGTLRVVTTRGGTHDVDLLDADTLTMLGRVADIGRGEDLHAVRFLGGFGYVVTYQQIDPLFVLDLRDPRHPTLAGSLKLTGYSGYLHDVGDGHLLGVGEATVPSDEERDRAHPVGLQLSLFDVAAAPRTLAQLRRRNSFGNGDIDPHAFLYWAPAHLAVVPLGAWGTGESGAALLVRVGTSALTAVGTVSNPASRSDDGTGITRTLVVGGDLWTFSSTGLAATDLTTLHRTAWVPFT